MERKDLKPRAIEEFISDMESEWNTGLLEKYCDRFSSEAALLGRFGSITGSDKIRRRLREDFPTPDRMWKTTIRISQFIPPAPPGVTDVPVVGVILNWTTHPPLGEVTRGYSLVHFGIENGRIRIIADATIVTEQW